MIQIKHSHHRLITAPNYRLKFSYSIAILILNYSLKFFSF